MDKKKTIYIMTYCEYLRTGMQSLISTPDISLNFIKNIDEVVITDDTPLTLLLVLDMSGCVSLKNFKAAVDFLTQINSPKRVGVMVSQYNSYLSHYISRKFRGKVTFFNAHNLRSGLFQRNFLSWLKGKTFRPMRVVARYRDSHYCFSLKEWISLVIPLSGETMQEMSDCMKIPVHTLYQIRQKALKKTGVSSYRQFCEMFINGEIRTENDSITRR